MIFKKERSNIFTSLFILTLFFCVSGDNLLLTQRGVKDRLTIDLDSLDSIVTTINFDSTKMQSLKKSIDSLRTEISNIVYPTPQDYESFKAIVPLNTLHSNIIKLYSEVLRYKGYNGLTIWKCNRYKRLNVFEVPSLYDSLSLHLEGMQNEIRSDVFNLTNASDNEITIDFQVDIPNITNLTLFQVEYVDTRELVVQASALVKLSPSNNTYSTVVPSGMTRQIWLRCNTKNLVPKDYHGTVSIVGEHSKEIPITISVKPREMNDNPDLSVSVWDYTFLKKHEITETTIPIAYQEMKDHYVNIAWGKRETLPFPDINNFNEFGFLKEGSLDDSKLKDWISTRPDMELYVLFFFLQPTTQNHLCGISPSDNPTFFYNAVKSWASQIQDVLLNSGIEMNKFAVHLLDEPDNLAELNLLKDLIIPFKEGAPAIQVFSNPDLDKIRVDGTTSWNAFLEIQSYIDILSPKPTDPLKLPLGYQDQTLKLFRDDTSKKLWFYSCAGSVRHYSPFYYSIQPIFGKVHGAEGSNFWSFSDNRCVSKNGWNEYPNCTSYVSIDDNKSYSPVFIDKSSITNSKHWEAFREGIYNTEYWSILHSDIKDVAFNNKINSLIHEAYRSYYYRSFYFWNSFTDDLLFDQIRKLMLSKILSTSPNFKIISNNKDTVKLNLNDMDLFPHMEKVNHMWIDWGDGIKSDNITFNPDLEIRDSIANNPDQLSHNYKNPGEYQVVVWYHFSHSETWKSYNPVSLNNINIIRKFPEKYKTLIMD